MMNHATTSRKSSAPRTRRRTSSPQVETETFPTAPWKQATPTRVLTQRTSEGNLAVTTTLLGLQQTHGNAHVQRLLQRATHNTSCNCSRDGQTKEGEHIAQRENEQAGLTVAPVAPVRGQGTPKSVVVYANPPASQIRIQGKTTARYNGGSFHTENVVTERGDGCSGCKGAHCIHATGDVVIDYAVTTRVTLPRIPAGLSECQQQRVQDAIDNDIAPHEQEHVDAFHTYDGQTTIPFDETLCRSKFDRMVRNLVRADNQPRQAAAQAQSDALDPHFVHVDLNCDQADSASAVP